MIVSSLSVHEPSALAVWSCAVVMASFKLSETTFLNIHDPYTHTTSPEESARSHDSDMTQRDGRTLQTKRDVTQAACNHARHMMPAHTSRARRARASRSASSALCCWPTRQLPAGSSHAQRSQRQSRSHGRRATRRPARALGPTRSRTLPARSASGQPCPCALSHKRLDDVVGELVGEAVDGPHPRGASR